LSEEEDDEEEGGDCELGEGAGEGKVVGPAEKEEEEGVGAADGAFVGVSTNAATFTSVALDRVRVSVRVLLEFWLAARETWVRMAAKRVEPPLLLRMAELRVAKSLSEEVASACSAVPITSLEPTISYVATIPSLEDVILLLVVTGEGEEEEEEEVKEELDTASSGSEMNDKGM
jgi:hypothetical protein